MKTNRTAKATPPVARVYLKEANDYVGPFCQRADAERFLELMELFGESPEGIEIVELLADTKVFKPRRKRRAVTSESTEAAS